MTNVTSLTTKEKLQIENEELIALNGQLQEMLEHQRSSSNELQSILYSTNVATLVLDADLRILFFTPATKPLFNLIPSDVGRPLTDLSLLAADRTLQADVRTVLTTLEPVEQEIETQNGAWYIRRVLPYRALDNRVEGVVLLFVDITERRRAAQMLEAARQAAELATHAKSRFLAAASHDLRQPLQTLSLMRGVLAQNIRDKKNDEALKLIARLDQTTAVMTGMLNTLLDINRLDSGGIRVEKIRFPINDLLDRLRDEFTYHAQTQMLTLRVVSSSVSIDSDPRLLELMIRNLLSNALKYTAQGKVLLGCRRHNGILSIEIRDTGVGIPEDELPAIFDEYHRIDNSISGRGRGLGLGLPIVRRLGDLLGHRVRVSSKLGKGSVFVIEVLLPASGTALQLERHRSAVNEDAVKNAHQTSTILIVEDDPEQRELLATFLKDEGHRTATVPDGIAALKLVTDSAFQPDLILADFNLEHGMSGIEVAAKLRKKLNRAIPVIILTGDISTGTRHEIALHDCVTLNKPVRLKDLTQTIQRLLSISQSTVRPPRRLDIDDADDNSTSRVIYVVDDDGNVRQALRSLLEDSNQTVEIYGSCEAFLEAYRPGREACLLLDAYLPGMSGLDLLQQLHNAGDLLPVIMITGNSDVTMAVQCMKSGAVDFMEKPIDRHELVERVQSAFEHSQDSEQTDHPA
ncbi:response regulator (plasmid) [Phyllobacterium sp. A18/5-2]|uniref:response regulator n=1 Tax=Phyllobacterium sp. A18/5-2 TaxID=2978392 RepID=UPI0021C7176F|nr:response regulator [Phyllobacterium sp. A18/5-2]UXN66108.1 response regulator [Phyllobacterium sp. A18/5-2]